MRYPWLEGRFLGKLTGNFSQAFPHNAQKVLVNIAIVFICDFGQLSLIIDLSLYTTTTSTDLCICPTYLQFDVLNKVMCQAGNYPEQI